MSILVLLAFLVGVAIVMGIYLGAARLPAMMAQRRLEDRLQEVTQPVSEEKETTKALVKVATEGPLPGSIACWAAPSMGPRLDAGSSSRE